MHNFDRLFMHNLQRRLTLSIWKWIKNIEKLNFDELNNKAIITDGEHGSPDLNSWAALRSRQRKSSRRSHLVKFWCV